ncbi:hypothetical protein T02_443 [Trichinella nativa]|uniref:Uncharacterized protein n=1 Tax=Trichinella nativa TaxID=6335 RepID=A0A0V1L3X2_9BILA|nr:hypothetical protein T02_443 [Trichinella nativa]
MRWFVKKWQMIFSLSITDVLRTIFGNLMEANSFH